MEIFVIFLCFVYFYIRILCLCIFFSLVSGCGYGIGVGGSIFTREDSCYQRSSRGEMKTSGILSLNYPLIMVFLLTDYTTGEAGE